MIVVDSLDGAKGPKKMPCLSSSVPKLRCDPLVRKK